MCIAAALSDRGVGSSGCSSNISSVGRLSVKAGVYERHLLQDEREGSRGGNDIALLRAEVRSNMRRNRRRVGKAGFRRHFDRGEKKKEVEKGGSGKNR
jgi:hypothetical protein